jgi:hypothetical protein
MGLQGFQQVTEGCLMAMYQTLEPVVFQVTSVNAWLS